MPIEKVPVVHKFGIISQTHQEELKKRLLKDERLKTSINAVNHKATSERRTSKSRKIVYLFHFNQNVLPLYGNQALMKMGLIVNKNIDELIYQINIEPDELKACEFEEKIIDFLSKVKYELTSISNKDVWNVYQRCWKDLSTMSNCTNRNVRKASLVMLRDSLCSAPLSKQLVQRLLEIALTTLQTLLPCENKDAILDKILRMETSFWLCIRLYYHHLAADLSEVNFEVMALHLINKGVKRTLDLYENNPRCYVMLKLITSMISEVCKNFIKDEEDFECQTFDENEKVNTEKRNYCTEKKSLVAKFLWNALEMWKSISRKMPLETTLFKEMLAIQLSEVSDDNLLEHVLAFYILCECAKVGLDYAIFFLQLGAGFNILRPKYLQKLNTKKISSVEVKNVWCWEMFVVYLHCLADISVCGMTIEIQKLSLFGNDSFHGMMDYLDCSSQDVAWKIRHVVYHLSRDVYNTFGTSQYTECLRNATWHRLLRYEKLEKDVRIVGMSKHESGEASYTTWDALLARIATNLSIIVLPSQSPRKTMTDNNNGRLSGRRRGKIIKQEEDTELPVMTPYRGDDDAFSKENPIKKRGNYEKQAWNEVKTLVAVQYQHEEDEEERWRMNMLENEIENIEKQQERI